MTDLGLSAVPYRVGYATGCFDLLHVGHLRYLEGAASACRELIVGIPDDEIVALPANKGRPPLVPAAQRLELIAALRCVTRALPVAISMEDTLAFSDFLRGLAVEAVFVGEDWQPKPRWQRLLPVLTAQQIAVHFLPRTPNCATTTLRNALNSTLLQEIQRPSPSRNADE